jgi:EmrB/QacA subfamily drug resistance transporter
MTTSPSTVPNTATSPAAALPASAPAAAPTSAPPASAPTTGAQRWLLAVTGLAGFMIALDATIVTTALGTLRDRLHASVASLEWTVNAYVLSFAVLMLTGSALGDRFGRRRLFVAGTTLFTVSSIACALAPNVNALIVARVFQGAGAAVVMPLAIAQLSAAFPPRARGKVMGQFGGIVGLATFSGPFVGGAVAQGLAWQWLFWVNVPVGIAVVAGTLTRVGESHGPQARFDLVGVVLATAGILGVVWALVRGDAAGWGSAETLGALIAGVLLTAGFAGWEIRTAAPMLPMRFFRIPAFTGANTASFAATGTVYGILFFLAQFYQGVLGYGPFGAGLRLMPWTGMLMICAPIAGKLSDRFGERRFVGVGLLVHGLALLWIAAAAGPHMSYLAIVPALVIGGAGLASAMPAIQKAAVGAVRPQEIGQSSGAFSMLRQVGGLFGTAIAVAVFSAAGGGYQSAQQFSDGFRPAMTALAVMALIGAAAAVFVPGRSRVR